MSAFVFIFKKPFDFSNVGLFIFMFITGDVVSQGSFDLRDLIRVIDLQLKVGRGGTWRIAIHHRFV